MARGASAAGRSAGASAARGSSFAAAALLISAALLPVVLTACKTAPPPVTRISGQVQAVAGVNPSVNQRPSPLRVRLYELKSATAFNQADFMSLYQSDQATLGADLVAREEMSLQPGETRPLTRVLAPETRFIGIVALYRDLERATWRTVVAVQPGKAQVLQVQADALAVSARVQ